MLTTLDSYDGWIIIHLSSMSALLGRSWFSVTRYAKLLLLLLLLLLFIIIIIIIIIICGLSLVRTSSSLVRAIGELLDRKLAEL